MTPAEPESPHRRVWVLLEVVCERRPRDVERLVVSGLDMTGRAPGRLHHWMRAARGEWLGVVTYPIRYVDGRRECYVAERQLVPADALRPRGGDE